MANRKASRVACAALLVLVSGAWAVAQQLSTDHDRGYALSQLKTFGIATHGRGPNDALAGNPIVDKRIAEALRQSLTAAGMQESDHPQFWVTYYASLKDCTDIRATAWGRPYWGFDDIQTERYNEGTLVVDFIDARTETHVWRATMTDTVEPNRRHDKLEKAVAKLVRKFQEDAGKQAKAQ